MPNTNHSTFLSEDALPGNLTTAQHDFSRPGETKAFRRCRRRSHEAAYDMGNSYLPHVRRTMSRQTSVEKQLVTKDFFTCCGKQASMTSRTSLRRKSMSFFPESRMNAGRTSPASTAKKLLAAWNRGPASLRDFHRWHRHF